MRIVVGEDSARNVSSVHLNGTLLTMCIAADDQEGWVRELIADPEKPGHAKHDGTGFLTRERRGQVVIAMKDNSRDWNPARTGKAQVQVGRDPRTKDILVQVFSVVRPGAIKQMRMHYADLPVGRGLIAQKAGACGGLAAELLCEQFKDPIDPSTCASEAQRQCELLLSTEAALGL